MKTYFLSIKFFARRDTALIGQFPSSADGFLANSFLLQIPY